MQAYTYQRHRRLAFTLIELLVVIGIVSALAALLFPAFASVREKARQTQCASNIRQIGMAFSLYLDDSDGSFPVSAYLAVDSGMTCVETAYTAVAPYAPSMGIFACPTDDDPLDTARALRISALPATCASSSTPARVSYLPNLAVIDQGYPNPLFGPLNTPAHASRSIAAIDYPADTALLYDARMAKTDGSIGFLVADAPIDARHNGHANVVYVDGHVKAVDATMARDPSGNVLVGTSVDGQSIVDYTVTTKGPYHGQQSLYGIPHRTDTGDWTLSPQ